MLTGCLKKQRGGTLARRSGRLPALMSSGRFRANHAVAGEPVEEFRAGNGL